MRIKWFSNACVQITTQNGTSILCDPWVTPGANLGSWFHWPPVPGDFGDQLINTEVNGIFISHLHSDHYDPKFISKFSKLKPEIPIYIPEFAHTWLKRSLESVVQKHTPIIEIPIRTDFEVGPGLTLSAFPADTCNPQVCLRSIPCQLEPSLRGIDGVAVFKGDGKIVVNANDAMSLDLLPKITGNIGQADLLMGHYGAASPFPQCFSEIEDKASAGEQIIERSCAMLIKAAESIGAKSIFPFAGQYILGGRLHELNKNLAVLPLDQTVNLLKEKTKIAILSVEPFGEINLANLTQHRPYVEPSEETKSNYLAQISQVEFIYEKVRWRDWNNPKLDLTKAANAVVSKSKKSLIKVDNSFVIGDDEHKVTINLFKDSEKNYAVYGESPISDIITKITMPQSLLRMLCQRKTDFTGFTPLHWNQADGGSHFLWTRKGEFDLNSHMLLNFFGT